MKITNLFAGLIIIILIQSCATTSNTTKQSDGDSAYEAGKFEEALTFWEQDIKARESKGKKAKAHVYMGAGKSALALNQVNKARTYLESAKQLEHSSPELYSSLAKVYKEIDNLSKEITALEIYNEKYPQGKEILSIQDRLFATYVESENWNLAVELWEKLKERAQTNPSLLSGFLIVNNNLGNVKMCQELAKKTLKLESNNTIAIEWYAQHFYWKAENLYVAEMKAYKKNRTQKQYNRLLKELEQVSANFRKARDYYLQLYKAEAKSEYATYLEKIYTRLDDKQKAAYYKKRAK